MVQRGRLGKVLGAPALAWRGRLDLQARGVTGRQSLAALPWMADDPVLSAFAAEDADTARAAIEELLPDLTTVGNEENDALAAWLRSWQRLWPDDAKRDPTLEGVALLDVLRVLRGRREQPVTVFCHLLLSALELHRLRQGLLQRAVFNDLDMEAAA